MEARSKAARGFDARPDPSDEANLLLQEGVDRLSATADIDGFLAKLLRVMCRLLDGHSAGIWRRDRLDPDGFSLQVLVDAETILETGTSWSELRLLDPDDPPCHRVMAPDGPPESEDALLIKAGVRSSVIVNLALADLPVGVLVVRLPHERQVLGQHRRLIERLAGRAAMALHLRNFAKTFAEAAAARAEKLAIANALLRETSERLGAVEDLDAFLGRVLLTMYEVVGGHSATLWLADPERPHHYKIHHVVEDGRVVPGALSSHPRREIGSTPTPKRLSDPDMYGPASKPHLIDLVARNGLMNEDERLYLLGLGVRQLLSVPLGVGIRVLGRYTIRLTDTRPILEDELDLIQALAGQAAVAVDLARLAEEAKQAAIVREREAAERSRADALHRANEVLRAMLEGLSEQQDLPAFLGDALTVCAREMDAVGAGIWIRRAPGEHGLLISWQGGEVRRPPEGNYLAGLSTLGRHLDVELARGEIAFTKLADYDAEEWDPTLREAIDIDHVRTAAQVPMFIGDRWLGTIVFRHASEHPDYPPERRELALAFGNQIALALEMRRLAAAAGEAAVLQERNRLAREIHDTLAQGFAAIRLQLELARGDSPAAAEALDLASTIAAESLVEARRSMAVLTAERPSLVEGLSAAIDGVRRLGGVKIVPLIGAAPEPPPEVAHELMRICQEAMLNAVRHAEAETMRVTLAAIPGRGVRIGVADDGKGFDPAAV
ncbi:MAG: GAF domain-containing protein, partial [Caulobacteraceae bacterium]|nr:GAF domain-containing protein [Caulobacteraceae bacterium]